MSIQKKVKNPVTRLFASSATIGGAVLYGAATGDVGLSSTLILGSGIEILNSVAPEVFGGAFDEYFVQRNSRDEILENGDLTRAIGQTIFHLCGQEADLTRDSSDKKTLQKLSEIDPGTWEDLVLGGGI